MKKKRLQVNLALPVFNPQFVKTSHFFGRFYVPSKIPKKFARTHVLQPPPASTINNLSGVAAKHLKTRDSRAQTSKHK